jgi:predicted RND superfamily exporter protein
MNKDFVGASRLVVVLKGKEENAIKDKVTLATMEKLGIYMSRFIEGVGGTMSLTDMVQNIFRMYHEGDPRWELVPVDSRHLGQIFFMLSSSMVPGEMDQYVSMPDYRHSNVTAFLRDYNNASIKNAISKVKEFAKDVKADEESKIEIKLAGGILGILAAVNEEVEWSYWAILVAIFTSTYLLCTFAYRSLKVALILIIPLAAAQVSSELLMLLLNIDLNINSLPVAAIGVGLGIDYGIYLMSRLREETIAGGDFNKARFMALSTTGKVIIFTAFNLSVGVSFWLLSAVKFQAEMGLLIGTLLWFNCISALVFIPALTGILKPSFVLKEGR